MAHSSSPSHYQVLRIARGASEAQVRAAYHSRLLELHPDKRGGDTAGVAELEAVRAAFQTLSDKQRRHEYDNLDSLKNTPPTVVVDTLTIDDFECVDDQFVYDCRCGGVFFVEASEITQVDIIPCDTCSLAVRIE